MKQEQLHVPSTIRNNSGSPLFWRDALFESAVAIVRKGSGLSLLVAFLELIESVRSVGGSRGNSFVPIQLLNLCQPAQHILRLTFAPEAAHASGSGEWSRSCTYKGGRKDNLIK